MRGADAGGGGRKIGFNTNHYMSSHIRGRGAGAKSAPQQMSPTPNFPRPLQNRPLQTIFCPQEMTDPPASALRMCEHTRGSAAGMSKSARLRSATAPRMCERSLKYLFLPPVSTNNGLVFIVAKVMRSIRYTI